MLNHFRTLLLNVDGQTSAIDAVAGELIDPGYRPVTLPGYLQTVRSVFFGNTPDLSFLNVRARQLLAAVHASPLLEFVTTADSRLTYDFNDQTLVGPAAYLPVVTPTTGLIVTGTPPPPDITGRMAYTLSVTTPSSGEALVEWWAPSIQIAQFAFTPDIRIVPAGLGLAFTIAAATSGQHWNVTVLARPTTGPADLVARLETIGEPTLDRLFSLTQTEPDLTLRNIFFRSPETHLRLAAAVCALVRRTGEVANLPN